MRRGESGLTGLLLIAVLLGAGYYFLIYQPGNNLIQMELTLYYEDGSTKTVSTSGLFVPQAITDTSGKILSSVSYTVRATPTYTGTATATAITGSVVTQVDGVQKNSTPITYSSLMASGTGYTVKTGSISASTIEGYNTVSGTHTLNLLASLTFTVTYASDSAQLTKTGSGTLGYSVVSQGIQALSVSVTATGVA